MAFREYKTFANDTIQHDFGTADELLFLAKLGSWYPARHAAPGYTRPELLRKYQATFSLRADWGSIDVKRVQEALTQHLKETI